LHDTGAIASIRAAEIYGLNVLAERIQVKPLAIVTNHFYFQRIVNLIVFLLPLKNT
jgi:hypothetical protein